MFTTTHILLILKSIFRLVPVQYYSGVYEILSPPPTSNSYNAAKKRVKKFALRAHLHNKYDKRMHITQ